MSKAVRYVLNQLLVKISNFVSQLKGMDKTLALKELRAFVKKL